MPQTHRKLDLRINVEPLQQALATHSYLFDQFTFRKDNTESPHVEMEDIIFRCRDKSEYQENRENFTDEHFAVWYESAKIIPYVKDIAFLIMSYVRGEQLGMVLCTKLKPGGRIHPHIDGGWHASFYKKYYIAIENKPGAVFSFVDGSIDPEEGEIFEFDNSQLHQVDNNSDSDRIALIVCIKGDT